MPVFICVICQCFRFYHQVTIINKDRDSKGKCKSKVVKRGKSRNLGNSKKPADKKKTTSKEDIDKKSKSKSLIDSYGKGKSEVCICKPCNKYVKQGKCPPMAYDNVLSTKMPDGLKTLNTLEEQLICPIIPFMKIINLHKTRQYSIHGPVICVPSNVDKTVNILPRGIDESSFRDVKLMRKLEYKGHHLYQRIRPGKVKEALHHLKSVHPGYN